MDGFGSRAVSVAKAPSQPDLRLVFRTRETGAHDQTFRLIVQPDLWGRRIVIWLEGLNNFSRNADATVDAVA